MHFRSFAGAVAALLSASIYPSWAQNIVEQTLTVVNTNLAPDGFERATVVVDGQFPGTPVTGCVGDRFMLNVVDNLTDPDMRRATSIHWHGLFQAHTTEMDGVSFVNQCPIVPGHSFLYDFEVLNQSGTYWYHSHLSTQYCDGLRGPIVIYDPNDPLQYLYDVDDLSTIITIADWYHNLSTHAVLDSSTGAATPDTTLINGLGRNINATGEPTQLSVVSVTQGLRYRFRIVGMSCFPGYNFSIHQHNLTVIETDGVGTVPYTVDAIQVEAGQRYSAVLTADKPIDNYWIRAVPTRGDAYNGTEGGTNSAILRYDGAPDADPTSVSVSNPVAFNESYCQPLINPGAPGNPWPGGADVNIAFYMTKDNTTLDWYVNNVSWSPPSVPVLLQILSGAVQPQNLMPVGSIYPLPINKTVEISFPAQLPHPMHLHGHNFDVVRPAGQSVYNYVNPIRRDVVSAGDFALDDNVTFRFTTDNPGPWFLHCHIDWHLNMGLAIVLAEDAPDWPTADPPNEAWEELCPLYNQLNPDTALDGII